MDIGKGWKMTKMDYKKLAEDLLSDCHMHCADCEYAGENEFGCTIARLSSTAITELLARAEVAEEIVAEYEESARAVFLWLYEFCDGTLPSPPMIGTAARKVAREYADMKNRVAAADVRCKELEARCKRLNEARERANEATHKWETMYRGKKEELEISQNEVSTMSTAGMEMLNAFSEYVRNGSKNPAAYCCYGAAGCGGDGDGCKGVAHCNFLPKSGMTG